VIDRDGTVLEALRSEMNMDVHADRALEVLCARRSAS
jgi:peroxiredoxin